MVLIVIDMQPCFEASFEVADQVVLAVHEAHAAGVPILFVEYRQDGSYVNSPTNPAILRAINGIKYDLVVKAQDDGGGRIWKWLDKKGYAERDLLLCGVNGSCCVFHTYVSLAQRKNHLARDSGLSREQVGHIKILERATACDNRKSWQTYYPDDNVWEFSAGLYFNSKSKGSA